MERSGTGLSILGVGVGKELGMGGDGGMNQNRLTTAFNRLNIYNRDDDGSDVSRGLHHPPLKFG